MSTSIAHLKKQAKNLQRHLPRFIEENRETIALSACQELIAKAHGYPSWYAAITKLSQSQEKTTDMDGFQEIKYRAYSILGSIVNEPTSWRLTFKVGRYDGESFVQLFPTAKRTVPKSNGALNEGLVMVNEARRLIDSEVLTLGTHVRYHSGDYVRSGKLIGRRFYSESEGNMIGDGTSVDVDMVHVWFDQAPGTPFEPPPKELGVITHPGSLELVAV